MIFGKGEKEIGSLSNEYFKNKTGEMFGETDTEIAVIWNSALV